MRPELGDMVLEKPSQKVQAFLCLQVVVMLFVAEQFGESGACQRSQQREESACH